MNETDQEKHERRQHQEQEMERDRADHAAWKRWRETTIFLPQSQLQDAVNHPDAMLPADDCMTFTAMLHSADELLKFITKFDNVQAFVDEGWLELVYEEGDEGWVDSFSLNGELMDEHITPATHPERRRLFEHNPYFEDEEVQLSFREMDVYYPRQMILSQKSLELQFPVLSHVCLGSTWDRMGDISYKLICMFELPTYDKHPIQVL